MMKIRMRKGMAMLVALCMLITMVPMNVFANFVPSDITGHWAQPEIQSWIDKGLIVGYPAEGTFKPEQSITRAEFMKLVNGAFGYTTSVAISYTDVKADAWYAIEVGKAQAAGYINGYPEDNTMRPENPITREEAAKIISKVNGLTADVTAVSKYPDVAAISDWAEGFVGAVTTAKIMQGDENGIFRPLGNITRAEAVKALDNAKKYVAPALAVTSVSAINAKEIVIEFNKDVEKGSVINASNYEIKLGGTPVAAGGFTADIDADNAKKVVLTLNDANAIQAITSVDVKVMKDLLGADFTKLAADYKTAFVFYDAIAPTITSAVVDGNELTVNFSEYVKTLPLMKVNGKLVSTTSLATSSAKEIVIDLSTLDLADGSYVFSAANVSDLQPSANIAPYLTSTIYVSDAAAAPTVKAITTKSSNTFQIEFTKALKAGTLPTVSAKKGSAEMVIPVGGVVAVAGSATKFTVTVDDVDSVVDLYATGETSVSLSVAISAYQASSNNLYGNLYNTTVTMSKDSVGPVLLSGYNKIVLPEATVIQVRFNEIINTVEPTKITVVDKNGVKLTVVSAIQAEDADGDNTFLNITMSIAITDGVQSITFNAGSVTDSSTNDNAAVSTTVTKGSSTSDIATVAVTAASNVISVNYSEKMAASALVLANYTLDNVAMPAGSVIYFDGIAQTLVKIELPNGSISNTLARVVMISSNVVADGGSTLTATEKTQVVAAGWVDNVNPVLISATKDTTTTIKVKFSEAMQAVIVSDLTYTGDFKVKVNGVEVIVSSVANIVGDADMLLLTIPLYNKTQTVTVETVKVDLTLTDASVPANIVKGETVVTAN